MAQYDDWLGRPITDSTGTPYGTLDELFVGRTTGEPEFGFVTVARPDGSGDKRVAVPLDGARRAAEVVVLPLDPTRVRDAPEIQRTVDEIPREAGERILEWFAGAREVHDDETRPMAPVAPPPADDDGDPEVTLSEERLAVDTALRPTGRVRLRKVVVEEDVTLTVTVRREELRVEREPLAPGTEVPRRGNGDAQMVEGELEFVLYAEEPVVEKRLVPVERVRVARDVVTEERTIADRVRRERADVEQTAVPSPTPEEPTP